MSEDNLKDKIREEVLLNATLFDGKANPKAVMGKILGKFPEFRKQVKQVSATIQSVIEDYKNYTIDDIKDELKTGDVFLAHGDSNISEFIEFITWSEWSHSGMVIRAEDIGE